MKQGFFDVSSPPYFACVSLPYFSSIVSIPVTLFPRERVFGKGDELIRGPRLSPSSSRQHVMTWAERERWRPDTSALYTRHAFYTTEHWSRPEISLLSGICCCLLPSDMTTDTF